MENQYPTNNNLEVNFTALTHLAETRKWTLFLSILGFVFLGLMVFTFIGIMAAGTTGAIPGITIFSVFFLLLICAIYFFPIYYLFQFSRYSSLAINQQDAVSFAQSMKFLKLHYRFMGILAIVGIGLYIVALIGILVGGGLVRLLM